MKETREREDFTTEYTESTEVLEIEFLCGLCALCGEYSSPTTS
jgi:hypothetical protein